MKLRLPWGMRLGAKPGPPAPLDGDWMAGAEAGVGPIILHRFAPAGWQSAAHSQRVARLKLGLRPSGATEGLSAADGDGFAFDEAVKGNEGTGCARFSATVVIPIHNEARRLPSTLHSFWASSPPWGARLNALLICNACEDGSERAAAQSMGGLLTGGFAKCRAFDPSALSGIDPSLEEICSVRKGEVRVSLLSTKTRGKGHVLNMANRIALLRGDRYALSFDADLWFEPDTLRDFYETIFNRANTHPRDAVVFFGQAEAPLRWSGSLFNRIAHRRRGSHVPGQVRASGYPGWIMAWETGFLSREGGFWPTALLDDQIALRAKMRGYSVIHSPARIWGWNYDFPSEWGDWLRFRIRCARGYYQNLAKCRGDPDYELFAAEWDALLGRSRFFRTNLPRLLKEIWARPRQSPLTIAAFLGRELTQLLGWFSFLANPNNPGWRVLKATK